ncbi:ROK family transcriptional regulator [Maridesulfovibrio hydrothermalis]|uniref:Putative Xylose repressor n=1 Tax=Maridesulfovibrio hydrothermalis AM13 = DSM 14728 TaxID=1121451 RepID=L0RCZ6_9BACT|nr:ROK family transcriptional regulator [Maridesulfovibrio hydrothermalis]CCO23406.1 putative Xylose repressor [Maridesulfovibrio hydrothermalis AM13 = DSM 14728]
MRAANKNMMRAINRCNILGIIRLAKNISRKDIAQQTGLSQATVTAITAEFIKEGIVYEKEAVSSTSGRPPVLLALNPDGAFVAGAYISAEKISVVIINLEAKVMASHHVPIAPGTHSPDKITDLLAEAIKTCRLRHGFIPDDLVGLGLGIPGLVNHREGVIHFHPGFNQSEGWKDVHFSGMVEKKTGFQTFIENSSNTLAIYEHWFGAARGCDNFIVVTLEHGVGLGILIDGRLVRGWKGMAGELGHVHGYSGNPLCRCGLTGCLEAVGSNLSILRDAKELADKKLWEPEDPDNITIETVIDAAKKGNPVLQDIFTRVGTILGKRISDLTRVFDPEKIIITGKSYLAKDMLFEPMTKAMDKRSCEVFGTVPEMIIRPWREGNYARGAGALVLEKLHQNCAIPDEF